MAEVLETSPVMFNGMAFPLFPPVTSGSDQA